MRLVILTGTPAPSAGPAPRSHAIVIATAPKLRIFGSADIDFAGCNPQGARGSVTRDYWVIRDPSVTGPITISLEGLPADVTGTVDPQTLSFPGGAIGERVTVNLSTIAGPTVPDTAATLHLVGSGIDLPFTVLVHGSCPQQNRNFVIRGQFGYLNANSVEPGVGFQPLKGAQVEFFRYRSDWYDDKVGETYTDDQGPLPSISTPPSTGIITRACGCSAPRWRSRMRITRVSGRSTPRISQTAAVS